MHKIFLFFSLTILLGVLLSPLLAQEALKSVEENYYDFLALQGITERPTLNYRTLSDSIWRIKLDAETDELPRHPWQNQNLGTRRHLFGDVSLRIYGPELFMSVNTTAPYGQNDGALWQGRGFNTSLTGGVRLDGYGVELTFKPQLTFSQNLGFDYIKPAYSGTNYAGKGEIYGYYGVPYVDAPQRFGNEPFFTWDWGDSEIRYTWKTLTAGFGTQAIWLGPAHINSIMHSNNTPTYPKLDIGVRRQPIIIPLLNWYIGDIEARLWTGYLSESDYFDNDNSNNHSMINALSFAYAPSFLPGLTLFINRSFLTKWTMENLKYIGELFFITANNEKQIQEEEDQRVSLGADWLLPAAGIEIYGEFAMNDYVGGGIAGYIRYPSISVFTVGMRKTFKIYPEKKIYGELLFEWNQLEMPTNYQFAWPTTFYAHHIVTQGYTNRGQWLGAGLGTGGNSQYLGFKIYYPKGSGTIFLCRNNPDNDYLYAKSIGTINSPDISINNYNFKANFILGIESVYFITKNISLLGGLAYNFIVNPLYNYENYLHNFHSEFGISLHY
jgi:hypothetical protein